MKKEDNYYIELAEKGMSYDDIKSEAKKDGIQNDGLRSLMRHVDDTILQKGEDQASKNHAIEWMCVGAAISLICCLMTIYSFIDPESHYIYIVYAGFFGGTMIFMAGWRQKKSIP
jgi:hypothetical protein